jgi:hypothetical protein
MSELFDEIALFLEKALRPGLLGLAGKALQKRCAKELRTYFASLGSRITEMKFEDLAHPARGLDAEHARHAVAMRMHNLLRTRQPLLKAILQTNLAAAIQVASKVASLAEAEGDIPAEEFGTTAEEAAAYAETQAAKLVTGLDATTQQAIADAVSTGIEDRLGVPGTARLIQDVIDGMTRARADMIAATEMNDAMSWAMLRKLQVNAVDYKEWILGPAPCEICIENADASPIPVDENFPSGDDAPPAHPNCVCALAGARGPVLNP